MAWGTWVRPLDLGLLAVGYVLTVLGVTVGFHRLLTHRAFKTYRPIRYTLAILGSAAVQGPVLAWVSDHRKHHRFSDQHGDPHSPVAGFGDGLLAAIRGFFHAHVGWLFTAEGRARQEKYVPDLLRDRGLVVINRLFPLWVALGVVIPGLVGWALTQQAWGLVTGMLWGGGVRIFLAHHVTFAINSICHMFGRRPFRTPDESRNVWLLSVLSLGESWHNNHHAFPTSAFHGLRPWQVDISGMVIAGLEKTRLAWDVTRVPPERQHGKLAQ